MTYMGTKEASEYAKVSPGKLREWIKEGFLKAVCIGRKFIFTTDDIDECMEKLKNEPRT
ncbi:MAG: helix-turn-helix domain-containing protein [Treponema sp.]|nr:helix-turn-helix domain-containing protein [Treponema sp.]